MYDESKLIAKWIGNFLREQREPESIESLAKKITSEESQLVVIKNQLGLLEAGNFQFKSGRLRQLLLAYDRSLQFLLEQYVKNSTGVPRKEDASFLEAKSFLRVFYSVRLSPYDGFLKTPLFVAGEPESYVWAVPLRQLRDDETCIEFLELAERRKKSQDRGRTEANKHPGSEIIYVIRGQVDQYIDEHNDKEYKRRPLLSGDLMHFDSSKNHYVVNASEKSTAFLMVIRLPK